MKKRSISFLLGLFLLISLISGCGGGGGGRDKGDGDKGSGSDKPYYYGTIKIQRDGTVNKLEIHELETITVYLYLDNGSVGDPKGSGWRANQADIEAKCNFKGYYLDREGKPEGSFSSNGLQSARPDAYSISMILYPGSKLNLNIGGYFYNCTYDPPIPGVDFWTVCGVFFWKELLSDLEGGKHRTLKDQIDITDTNGYPVHVGWDLTLYQP